MKTNEFAKISKLLDTVITKYRDVRSHYGIPDDGWHSRSIERLAKPFMKGYFTLAIVGKVSSGKSSFINALLGCKGLLPTGHDQTTSVITYLEYGEKPEVKIVFGDGHTRSIEKDIVDKIKEYVSIPDEFHDLPVNNIDDLIMGDYDFNQIWQMRNEIEIETSCATIKETLLKKYVQQRKKANIPTEVYVRYPFSEELKGWRLIDTPGVGAIGGIENRTKSLLELQKEDGTREIDAIIFLQNGSETLDQSDTRKFVATQLENFSEADKGRLFYVLTHSASSGFLNHKDGKIQFMQTNYGDKIKVLTYADSLLRSFLDYYDEHDIDLKYYEDLKMPANWDFDDWDVLMGILDNAKRHLRRIGDTFNNDTMLRTLQEWSHFSELKQQINDFAKSEKQITLRKLLNLIALDYLGFIKQLEKEKKLVDGDLTSINNAIKAVEQKRTEYNILAQRADNMISIEKLNKEFSFIDESLRSLENYDSIDSVRTAITNLFDSVRDKEKQVFEQIITSFSDFFKEYDPNDIILGSIDFESIEKEATANSQEDYVTQQRKVIKKCCEKDVIIPAKYGKRTNYVQKVKEFKLIAIRRSRSQRDQLLPQITKKIARMRDQVLDELNRKIKAEIERLEGLKKQLARKSEFKAENDAFIAESHAASEELIKLAQDYGYEF